MRITRTQRKQTEPDSLRGLRFSVCQEYQGPTTFGSHTKLYIPLSVIITVTIILSMGQKWKSCLLVTPIKNLGFYLHPSQVDGGHDGQRFMGGITKILKRDHKTVPDPLSGRPGNYAFQIF
jgi:hypothetical protein